MRRALIFTVAVGACSGGSGGGGGGPGGDGGAGRDAVAPGDGSAGADAAAGDAGLDGGLDAGPGGEPSILYQCTAFDGGLCAMKADGSEPTTLHATGFAPRGLAGGSILFHTAGYRVARRAPGGAIDDLGDGAFPRPAPGGRIVFQCAGLAGGLCSMAADGSDRTTIRATGRVPDVDAAGALLFHTDAYRVVRRAAGGQEDELGPGAFARWLPDGRVLFQCSGLDGGLCRMAADGTGRITLHASGRVPDARADGELVFHTDDYTVSRRTPSGVTPLRPGANAVWW